jgi:hypothetical protein
LPGERRRLALESLPGDAQRVELEFDRERVTLAVGFEAIGFGVVAVAI